MSLAPTKKAEPREPTHQDIRALETIAHHAGNLSAALIRHIPDPAARKAALDLLRQAVAAGQQGVLA